MTDINGLTITEVKFWDTNFGKMVAWADVTFNDFMTVKSFKIFKNDKGYNADVPAIKNPKEDADKKYINTVWFPKVENKYENLVLQEIASRFAETKGESVRQETGASDNNDDTSTGVDW